MRLRRKRSIANVVQKQVARAVDDTFSDVSKALQRTGKRLQRDTNAKIRELRKSLAPLIRGTGKAGAQAARDAEKQIEAIAKEARKAIRQALNAAADSLERNAKKL